ncbi:endonuclease V [Salinarchaeum sp. Harcht-Bsk1]|uniref:endonuclease V n=1 Tax=Salinarchaeum sp. Harcht-Bsk1 TaxID=1333523 RepID=UPI00034240CB|nr:endonuclease V [Salinarchaeum sp. Harcht-Bsk1]AGN01819.1 endonuclease V [Salinarchaeum sp. Harcht-Bsk1]
MVSIQHPEYVPDPSLDREDMEALQRELAADAVFGDAFDFDPTAIGATATADARQTELDGKSSSPVTDELPIVAGIDQAFQASDGSQAGPGEFDEAVSAVVAMQDGEVIERVFAASPLEIPYVPGLLSFREGRSILAALAELSVEPDVLLLDGSGRIHFREAGIATHIGVTVDVPAVGVAKSLLCGTPRWADAGVAGGEPLDAGTIVPIAADDSMETPPGTIVGAAVQTRQFASGNRSINPLYVSPGHRVGWETAAQIALATAGEYKLPEPIRLADQWVGELTAAE